MYFLKILGSLVCVFLFVGFKNFLIFETELIVQFVNKDIFQNFLDFLQALTIMSFSLFFIFSINFFIFEKLVKNKMQIEIPKFLIQSLDLIIFLMFIIMVLNSVYNVPLTGLLAVMSVVGVGLAYGMRELIADIFAGIALSIEKPFKIKDCIMLEDGTVGEVYDITWKSTSLKTAFKTIKIIPNGKISSTVIQNLNKNGLHYVIRKNFYLPFNVPIDKVRNIVLSVLEKQFHNDKDYDLEKFDLSVDIISLSVNGVEYQIQFYCKTIFVERKLTTNILTKVINELQKNSLQPSYQNLNILNATSANKYKDMTKIDFFKNVDLFSSLREKELELLINRVFEKNYEKNDKIIVEKDSGDSLFILSEGLLKVEIFDENTKQNIFLGFINSGEYFGEFSLLTGKPRSATVTSLTKSVVYEIVKDDIFDSINNNTKFFDNLSNILTKREISNKEKLDSHLQLSENDKEEIKNGIVSKMKQFFKI